VIEIERKTTGCGNAVMVQSGSWWHRYCHLKTISVKQGQIINTGTVLGTIGQTGSATGPHLHLEFYFARRILDPARVLRAMYRAIYGIGSA
jgi:murein DD-endopeptidase MepM/ murein hydrolase activator NlpD